MTFFSLAAGVPRALHVRLLAAALLASCALGLVTVQRAAADSWPYVQSASTISFPGDAVPGGGSDWYYNGATACASSHTCVLVGTYQDKTGQWQAYVVPITDGVPGAMVKVALPTGAQTSGQDAGLDSVACQADGTCEAVGYYDDATGTSVPMFVRIVNGQPAQAVGVQGPADSYSNEYIYFNAISCSPSGPCEAVGEYWSNNANEYMPIVDSIVGGVPQQGTGVTLPANYDKSKPFGELYGVACQSGASCTAVGYYADANEHNAALVVGISNGVPGAGSQAIPPLNADSGNPDAYLEYVGCPASGTCQAIGYYDDSSGNTETLVVPISGGSPGGSSAATVPTNSKYSEVYPSGISCSSQSLCVAAGYYTDNNNQDQGVVLNITPSGATSHETVLPSDAYPTTQDAAFYTASSDVSYGNPVACVSGGACLAGGYYSLDASEDSYAGLLEQITATGVTSPGVTAAAPADQNMSGSGPYTYLYLGTGCVDSGSCISAGVYENTAGYYMPYVVSEQAPLGVSTTSLPGATQGSSYSTTLAASGAWGTYSWSVSSGSLPNGLSLDPQTGVITGAPTGSGTSTFTVEATGTGSPAQTASEQLSLTVAAKPSPPTITTSTTPTVTPSAVARATVRVLHAGGKLRADAAGVKLSCAGATCHGTVKIRATETLIVKHGKRRVRRHRTVVIGTARFITAAGHTRSVAVHLNAIGRRLLAHARHHRLAVEVLASAAGGNSSERHATIWMAIRKHVKHRKKH